MRQMKLPAKLVSYGMVKPSSRLAEGHSGKR